MKKWIVKIFDVQGNQMSFKDGDEIVDSKTFDSNSKFSVKKSAKNIVGKTPGADSYSMKMEG